ncbi:hypothetical protein FGO68_gene309 [Halteria grandinella]|uniref:Uncharacterized protein n=1 Tax=Halteria grandinella TaxID=5974 RepID=A0A8J8NY88_HALGN|nr:hypothetical protein FGO68_gene309 [Halteria grandinella]
MSSQPCRHTIIISNQLAVAHPVLTFNISLPLNSTNEEAELNPVSERVRAKLSAKDMRLLRRRTTKQNSNKSLYNKGDMEPNNLSF